MLLNNKVRDHVAEVQGQVDSEKEWWEKRREQIRSDLYKELDGDKTAAPGDGAVPVDSPAGGKK